jgi:hypothetical protein
MGALPMLALPCMAIFIFSSAVAPLLWHPAFKEGGEEFSFLVPPVPPTLTVLTSFFQQRVRCHVNPRTAVCFGRANFLARDRLPRNRRNAVTDAET